MRLRTVTPTAIPGVVGTRQAEVRTNITAQVTRTRRRAAIPVPVAGDRRTRVADHRLSAEATVEAGGPGRIVLAAGGAAAEAAVGAAAAEAGAEAVAFVGESRSLA